MKSFFIHCICLFFILAAAPNLSADQTASPSPVKQTLRLMLDWFPNVDHLPVYVAREKGYFKAQGISVEIISPSETADALKLAATGNVDLTTPRICPAKKSAIPCPGSWMCCFTPLHPSTRLTTTPP
jgi:putative hydroxymethylpyrimidine transport system substrate-binding protein